MNEPMGDAHVQPDTLECLARSNNCLVEDIYVRVSDITAMLFGPELTDVNSKAAVGAVDGVAPTLMRTNERLRCVNDAMLGIIARIKA
jgi:hypothetical protein